jgi:hypothetical protein
LLADGASYRVQVVFDEYCRYFRAGAQRGAIDSIFAELSVARRPLS